MAEKITAEIKWNKGGRPPRYPWDEWLDGGIWLLKPGEDFSCQPANFRSLAFTQARARNLSLRTLTTADGFVLQAREKT